MNVLVYGKFFFRIFLGSNLGDFCVCEIGIVLIGTFKNWGSRLLFIEKSIR